MSVGTLVWEVRTTGDDTNGGSFDATVASPGTDYSQQNAAQVTYTDLVIDASNNSKVTSALNPFTSAHVGNTINVTGGSGFTQSRYTVNSVAASVATLSSAIGTTSSTGGTGKLGGALASPGEAAKGCQVQSSNGSHTVWVKSGTYSISSSTQNVSGGRVNTDHATFIGYGSARADYGTKPVFQATATGFTMVISAVLINICLDGNSQSGSSGFFGNGWHLQKCEIKNFASYGCAQVGEINDCAIHDNGGIGVDNNGGGAAYNCIAYNNSLGFDGITCSRCIAYNNTGGGFTSFAYECTAYGHTGTGAYGFFIQQSIAESCISYGNYYNWSCSGGSGLDPLNLIQDCASGGATNADQSANIPGKVRIVNLTSLSANPFTNAGAADFSLNNTAGGGAACQAAGTPASQDIGAVQTAATAADYPSEDDVRDSVSYDSGGQTGNMTLPAITDVKVAVQYGTNGTEFTGTYAPGGSVAVNPMGGLIRP